MNYEDLRKYQRMERNAPNLAEISETFYSDLNTLISGLAKDFQETHSIDTANKIENIKKIANEIFERREQKLALKAVRCARNRDLKEENAVEQESDLLNNLINEIRVGRENFEK